ncbi:non-contractile tail fiber protein [Salmonella phage Kenya-K30]|nr:non-contractile tail fiber protein [Salmonella phage Kenya-K30]
MSYTFTEHTAVGTQTTYPFSFAGRDKGYIRASDIIVEVFHEGEWHLTHDWVLSGTHQITFNVALIEGTKFRIRRDVSKEYPYAEFDRGVALDMKSLNNSFIHILQITQGILDGFYPEGYFVKQHVSWGGYKITDLADGTDPNDAVNKGQLDAIDRKHTEWNEQQDIAIAGLKAGMTSGVSHRTVPWVTVASGGEQVIRPPYIFESALVFLDGVLQHELSHAVTIANSTLTFSEPLRKGTEVYVLIGSRIAASSPGLHMEFNKDLAEGTTDVRIGLAFSHIDIYLDGLFQPKSTYQINGDLITFSEGVPACHMSADVVTL